jgi:lipopolysaccharide biosynthesis glycosyltransferase
MIGESMMYSSKMMPFLLATDENNYLAAAVTVQSIINNCGFDQICVYVLVPLCFTDTMSTVLYEIASECDNVSIQVIKMDESRFLSVAKKPDRITGASYITVSAWFRLSAATLLEQYDACIYLDTDTVVVSSLRPLLDLDFDEYYIAGVLAPAFVLNKKRFEYAKDIGIPDYHSFVNSGVLVMNLKLIRHDCIESKFYELVENGLYDQDVVNVACYGRILILPQRYNLTKAGLSLFHNKLVLLHRKFLRCRTFEEMRDACLNPAVVHYTGTSKPWNTANQLFGHLWFREAETFLTKSSMLDIKFPVQSNHSCYLLNPYNPISIIVQIPRIISKIRAVLKKMSKSVFENSNLPKRT